MSNERMRHSAGPPDRLHAVDAEQAQVDLALRHDSDSVDWAREILSQDPAATLD
ncbi:hypothetical protein [Curtobacterium ammoniigenes]|uniref:hypothetical protein n=1 Tax=Curtobacterium ammoniigenes TaxID=395387 RepID=UPI0012EE78A5|nr:hypothetical protein [Curtobacterium ammoniigenes]